MGCRDRDIERHSDRDRDNRQRSVQGQRYSGREILSEFGIEMKISRYRVERKRCIQKSRAGNNKLG